MADSSSITNIFDIYSNLLTTNDYCTLLVFFNFQVYRYIILLTSTSMEYTVKRLRFRPIALDIYVTPTNTL